MTPEQLLVVLPIDRLVGRQRFKISKSEVAEAAKLPKSINAYVSEVIEGSKDLGIEPAVVMDDVTTLKETVLALDMTTLMQDILPKLEASGVGIELAPTLITALQYLQQSLPKEDYIDTPLAVNRTIESSTSTDIKFLWKAQIIDNPLYILQLMVDQQISNVEVFTLLAVYPDIYDMIVTAFIDQIIEKYSTDAPLPRRLRLSLSTLLQLPVLNTKTLLAYNTPTEQEPNTNAPEMARQEIQ